MFLFSLGKMTTRTTQSQWSYNLFQLSSFQSIFSKNLFFSPFSIYCFPFLSLLFSPLAVCRHEARDIESISGVRVTQLKDTHARGRGQLYDYRMLELCRSNVPSLYLSRVDWVRSVELCFSPLCFPILIDLMSLWFWLRVYVFLRLSPAYTSGLVYCLEPIERLSGIWNRLCLYMLGTCACICILGSWGMQEGGAYKCGNGRLLSWGSIQNLPLFPLLQIQSVCVDLVSTPCHYSISHLSTLRHANPNLSIWYISFILMRAFHFLFESDSTHTWT